MIFFFSNWFQEIFNGSIDNPDRNKGIYCEWGKVLLWYLCNGWRDTEPAWTNESKSCCSQKRLYPLRHQATTESISILTRRVCSYRTPRTLNKCSIDGFLRLWEWAISVWVSPIPLHSHVTVSTQLNRLFALTVADDLLLDECGENGCIWPLAFAELLSFAWLIGGSVI